jgi:glycosyltransferase involved in cell wall biosynthesis
MNFQNKKVLIIIKQGTLGGAERQALTLGGYLIEHKNCEVDILLTSSNNMTSQFKDNLKKNHIKNVLFFGEPYLTLKRELTIKNLKRLKWSVQYLLKMRRILKNYEHEVLIPFLNFPSKLSYYLYKILPQAKYTFWHQLGLDTWKFDLVEYVAVKNIPIIIGNAENCFDVFINNYEMKREEMFLLPQYLSLQKVNLSPNLLKVKFDIPRNRLVFGMIAHFAEFKYHSMAYEVFKKINSDFPETHLILMGNEKNDDLAKNIFLNLKNSIETDGMTGNVTLLTNQSVTEVLNTLDVGILLSLTEGTPNVVMEYMEYGLPVIATKHPGCVALLGQSKFLVNNYETEIYNSMVNLIQSKKIRKAEGVRNSKVIKKYSVKEYVSKLEKILSLS